MATEIEKINSLFAPLGLSVNDTIRGSQSIKYILNLPLDYKSQGKIRRAETDLKYALSSCIDGEFIYGHENNYVYIERKVNNFQTVPFTKFQPLMKSSKLRIALGQDQNGQLVYTDLAKAVHILVAGTTGSGKSELLHTFIASIISGMPYTGAELLIIDPKRSEYTPYKNTKSVKVVTEMDEASACINRAVEIMEERYTTLEKSGSKDIYSYSGDMHPIIIVIDELSDLMQTNPQVEKNIVRIAQKSRACGIHLIIGTQSPRREVVTGLIKANIPTKIALKTSTQVESRIILDRIGAEKLFGKGDMLYLANGSFEPMRIQAAYVNDKVAIGNLSPRTTQPHTEIQATTRPEQPTINSSHPKKKRMGLFRTLKAIYDAPQITGKIY